MNPFLNLQNYVLPNGLRVLLLPENGHNLVTYHVWYRVGSRFETDETRGLSHFLEHLFFKGTKKYGAGVIDRRLNEIGAFNNAATSKDYTYYYTVGVSDYFEEMFEIQTEMLLNPAFEQEEIDKEREVVIAEIHRANDSPTHQFYYKSMERLFKDHPYSQRVLGFEEIISSVSRETISNYFQSHYHPTNMTIVLAGNFSTDRARHLIEESFGGIPRRDEYAPKATQRIVHAAGRELFYARTQRNYSSYSFLGPTAEQAQDILALDMLGSILTDSRSSRWKKHFKEDLSLVESISFGLHTSVEQGPIMIHAQVKDDQWGAYHEAIDEALDKLRRFYVTREELHSAREYDLVQADFHWEKMSSKAQSLGYYASLNQLGFCTDYKEMIKAIRLEDIVRVIEKYLTEEPNVTQMLSEEKQEVVSVIEEESHHSSAHTLVEIAHNQSLITFDSGLQVHYCHDPSATLCSADLFAKNLCEAMFRFPPGTGYLMQRLISRGTSKLTADQIMEVMDRLGGRYSTVCSDSSTRKDLYRNSLAAPSSSFWNAFEIFSSFFTEASFPDSEMIKSRDSILLEIKALPDSLSAYCLYHMMKNYFHDHPYGIPFIGTDKSVRSITRKDMGELYSILYSPANVLLTLSGPFPVNEVIEKCHEGLNRQLGALKVGFGDSKIPDNFESPVLNQMRTAKNSKEQAYIIRTFPAPGFKDPDFFTAHVVNEVLGGGMSSRFFRILRDEKSYGYEVGSRYQPYLPYGIMYSYLGTDPARLENASKDFQILIEEIQNEKVSEAELLKARNLVVSRFSFAQETLSSRASMAGSYLAREMSSDFIERYVENIQAVTSEKVLDYTQKYFSSAFEQRVHP